MGRMERRRERARAWDEKRGVRAQAARQHPISCFYVNHIERPPNNLDCRGMLSDGALNEDLYSTGMSSFETILIMIYRVIYGV
jgi:hypothetical protein